MVDLDDLPALDRPLVLVDVGCRWGVDERWTALPQDAMRVYAFDADADECVRLQAGAPANVTYVPTGLAAASGRRVLHVAEEPACSSLFPPDPLALERFPGLGLTREVARSEIALTTLREWAAAAGIDHVDIVKLDVQGAELEVLRGAGDLLDGVGALEIEVAFNPMYTGQPLFGDIDAYLRARGFRLWRLSHLVHYGTGEVEAPGTRADRQFFDDALVEFASAAGQVTWGHALYVPAAAVARTWPTPQAARRDGVVAALVGLPELAGPALDAANAPPTPPATDAGNGASAPFSPEETRRIALTTSVTDSADIPKVPGAGTVREVDGTRVQVMHNGVLVEEGGYYGRWMTEVIRRLDGHHEPQEEKAVHVIMERLARDGGAPLVVELGAFWAYYSLWARTAVPGARSVLVEPDPAYLAVGRRNFALNGLDAEFRIGACGDTHGSRVDFVCESDGVTRPTPVVTVDGLLADLGADRCELLLVDVQGAELDVLRGAAGAIAAGRLRFVVVSTHHHLISGDPLIHERCLDLLTAAGAHVVCEHTVHESASGDGLVVASFDPRDRDLVVEVSHVRARDSLFGGLEADLAAALDARTGTS